MLGITRQHEAIDGMSDVPPKELSYNWRNNERSFVGLKCTAVVGQKLILPSRIQEVRFVAAVTYHPVYILRMKSPRKTKRPRNAPETLRYAVLQRYRLFRSSQLCFLPSHCCRCASSATPPRKRKS